MKWKTVKLGSIANILSGFAFKSTWFQATGTPVIRIGDICEGEINISSCVAIDENVHDVPKICRANAGDILMALSGATTGKIGIVNPDFHGVLVNQRIAIIRSSDINTQKYLKYIFTEDLLRNLLKQAWGSAQANLSPLSLRELEIPFPPLEEQHRIAAILDKADAIRRKRFEAIRLTEELLRAAFLDMFGDPVTNPKGWEVVELGAVTESKLGKMLSETARKGISPIKYIGNSHVQWRSFNLEQLPEMDFSEEELQKLDLKYGDLMVCEGGEVGRCAIWRNQMLKVSFQKALHRVRCQTTLVLPEYLQEYFVFMAERGGLVSSTSTATIAHLTGVRLKQLPLPLPPIDLQKSFQQIYKSYEDLNFKYQRTSNEEDNFFNSLLHRAFRGEL